LRELRRAGTAGRHGIGVAGFGSALVARPTRPGRSSSPCPAFPGSGPGPRCAVEARLLLGLADRGVAGVRSWSSLRGDHRQGLQEPADEALPGFGPRPSLRVPAPDADLPLAGVSVLLAG
jgi:hypothetical protein